MLLEREKPDVKSYQRLRDFILEFAANFFAFVLLAREKLMGELTQAFLKPEGFFQTFVVQLPAFFVGILHDLALGDALLQMTLGVGKFRCAVG